MEQKLDGGAISTPTPVSGYNKHLDETVRVADLRADVERVTDSPAHARIRNQGFSHNLNFDQQIREIDDAINGNVSTMILKTSQAARAAGENNVHGLDMAMLGRKESNHASGPHVTAHIQSFKDGPQGTFLKPMQEQNEEMGLLQFGMAFSLRLSSTKQHLAQGVKKIRGGNERKNKENKEGLRKDKKLDREETQHQGDTNNVASTMEYEMMDMGIKRRARTPLAELRNKEDNGKWVKMEGEIKELDKILGGSAEAVAQPRRTQ